MTKHIKLDAEARAQAGKGAARAVRREKKVPAVIYGDNKEPVLITLTERDLLKHSTHQSFFTSICDIVVDGKEHKTMARDVQVHPVNDRPMHVDFLRVTDRTKLDVQVPVHLENEDQAPGIKEGGVVNLVRHELTLNCSANKIPAEILIDISSLNIGDSIHIGELKLPAGAKAVEAEELTVLTIAAPTIAPAEDEATDAPEFEEAPAEAGAEEASSEEKSEG